MIAIDPIRRPGRPAGWCNHRVEFVFLHDKVDALFAGQAQIFRQRAAISLFGEWPFCLGLEEKILAKVRHLPVAVLLVKVDDLL